jgi:hypothetical protein
MVTRRVCSDFERSYHEHQQALQATVAGLKPKLLVLDPLVLLHCIGENLVAEVAPLLAYLRTLQRHHSTAVALVHHARKGAAHERGGQALRGSSELHAWGHSNLYLRRNSQHLHLSIEHRAAPSADRLQLALRANSLALALEVIDPTAYRAAAGPIVHAFTLGMLSIRVAPHNPDSLNVATVRWRRPRTDWEATPTSRQCNGRRCSARATHGCYCT